MKTWAEWLDSQWEAVSAVKPCPHCRGEASFVHIGDRDMFITPCAECKGTGVQPRPDADGNIYFTPFEVMDLQQQYIGYLWGEIEKLIAPLKTETPNDEGVTLLK